MRTARVCVIGAGASGIPSVKALIQAGLDVDCYEASDEVGGNWCIRNNNGLSSAYDSLHINTSRERMQYADYPMPGDYPDFPGHALIKQYFDRYVDHFQLRERIRFETSVENAAPEGDLWRVDTSDGQSCHYDALVVANGHHWDPRWPEPDFDGSFSGQKIHAHDYRNPTEPIDMRGQRVLVIGCGNSAMDIACELSRPGLTEQVTLSARSPTWIIPRYLFGRPLDQLPTGPIWLPWRIRNFLSEALLRVAVGTPDRYGAPKPEHRLLAAHPTVSSEMLDKLGGGDVSWKPKVRRYHGEQVEFVDGSKQAVDCIVYCTGYNIRFPFFNRTLINPSDNQLSLWQQLLQPARLNLFFVGLMQPLGAIMPLAEQQAKLLAQFLSNQLLLPDQATMERQMERHQDAIKRRYRPSARHTIQVDFDQYLNELQRLSRQRPKPGWRRFDQWRASAAAR